MKTKFLSLLVVAGLVAGGIGSGIGGSTDKAEAQQVVGGGALIAAIIQVQDVEVVDVVDIRDNNVEFLQNFLNNSLNNNRVLNDNDVRILTVGDVLSGNNIGDIAVDVDLLNNVVTIGDVEVNIDDIVAVIDVIGGGVVVVT